MTVLLFLLVLVLVYSIWTCTIKLGSRRLRCSRAFSQTAVFEGEEGQLIETVRNDTPLMIPWLRIESRISPHLQLGRQERLHTADENYHCSLFTLMPHQQIKRTHRVRFLRRGAYDLGRAALTAGDLLGLCRFSYNQELRAPVLVYPSLLSQEELPLPISRVLGELVRRPQLQTDPFLIRGIRPYQLGDPVRDIHWAATARTGDVQVRVHDFSARSRLLVVLNIQQQDIQWSDYIPTQQESFIEDGIRLAASACVHALRAGLSAGFASNMPIAQGQDSTLLLPCDGPVQEETLLAAFARLRLHRTETFPALLDSLTEYTGLDLLILSPYDSESIQTMLAKLRRAGNQVFFHLLKGGGV